MQSYSFSADWIFAKAESKRRGVLLRWCDTTLMKQKLPALAPYQFQMCHSCFPCTWHFPLSPCWLFRIKKHTLSYESNVRCGILVEPYQYLMMYVLLEGFRKKSQTCILHAHSAHVPEASKWFWAFVVTEQDSVDIFFLFLGGGFACHLHVHKQIHKPKIKAGKCQSNGM